MKLNKTMIDALNEQLKHEFSSAYQYLALAAYFESVSLPGFAQWMRLQREEELGHAMRLFEFILAHDADVELHALAKPTTSYASHQEAISAVLAHEESVTQHIHSLYEQAIAEKAHSVQVELTWFITEQLEEEKTARDLLEQVKMAGDNPAALLVLDREFGSRTSTA